MLPSLQDLPGLFPGIFHRGDAAAAETAGRGQGQRQAVEHRHAGRDSLSLSPEARAVEKTATEGGESVGDAVAKEAESKSPLGQAGGFVRKALETIRHDLAKALQAFGFDNDAIQNFTRAFVEPVLAALKEGVNFTAELSFAAFSQTTTVSAGGVSQSTSLIAQSLEIEVNRDTGEVSVSVARLSFDQQIAARRADGAAPLLVIDPDDLASPGELAQQILDAGAPPVEAAPAEPVPQGDDADAAAAEETAATAPAGGAEDEAAPAGDPENKLAEVREKLAEEAVDLQTRLMIYSVSSYQNDKGESITRLLLDAQLRITALAEDVPVQEEAESLNLTA
jgi:hypothetical protein